MRKQDGGFVWLPGPWRQGKSSVELRTTRRRRVHVIWLVLFGLVATAATGKSPQHGTGAVARPGAGEQSQGASAGLLDLFESLLEEPQAKKNEAAIGEVTGSQSVTGSEQSPAPTEMPSYGTAPGGRTAGSREVARPVRISTTGVQPLEVRVGKSVVIESQLPVMRVAVSDDKLAEVVVVSPHEVLVHGRGTGEATLILWQQGGSKQLFDLKIREPRLLLEAVQAELDREFPGRGVTVSVENEKVFVRGIVKDLVEAERAIRIASALGEPVNLLQVEVPPQEPQILLKVRFADVDRSALDELGLNLFSLGALNTVGSATTGQFSPPQVSSGGQASVALTDALNLFLFRPDLNLGATIRALEQKRLLQILAEPNLLTLNGKTATFLAGGEFPVPVIQAGAAAGAITIMFREFGIRLTFTPRLTPRGTIRLAVEPEVSSLDFANAVVIGGFTIPAVSTRRVSTEVELKSGQSFAIAGLLDNRVVETLSKVPGLGDIPVLGKLFQSRSRTRSRKELLVVVTPEVVEPIEPGQELHLPGEMEKYLGPETASQPVAPHRRVEAGQAVIEHRVVPVEVLSSEAGDVSSPGVSSHRQSSPAPASSPGGQERVSGETASPAAPKGQEGARDTRPGSADRSAARIDRVMENSSAGRHR